MLKYGILTNSEERLVEVKLEKKNAMIDIIPLQDESEQDESEQDESEEEEPAIVVPNQRKAKKQKKRESPLKKEM